MNRSTDGSIKHGGRKAARSGRKAVLLSLLFPGAGQIYAGWKGVGWGTSVVAAAFLLPGIYCLLQVDYDHVFWDHDDHFEIGRALLIFYAAIWLLSLGHVLLFAAYRTQKTPDLSRGKQWENFRTAWPDLVLAVIFLVVLVAMEVGGYRGRDAIRIWLYWWIPEFVYLLPVFFFWHQSRREKKPLTGAAVSVALLGLAAYAMTHRVLAGSPAIFAACALGVLGPRLAGALLFPASRIENYSFHKRCMRCVKAFWLSLIFIMVLGSIVDGTVMVVIKAFNKGVNREFLYLWGFVYYALLAALEMLFGPMTPSRPEDDPPNPG